MAFQSGAVSHVSQRVPRTDTRRNIGRRRRVVPCGCKLNIYGKIVHGSLYNYLDLCEQPRCGLGMPIFRFLRFLGVYAAMHHRIPRNSF